MIITKGDFMIKELVIKLIGSESFWAALVFGFSVYSWGKTKEKEMQGEKLQALEKKVENDLRLKAEFRDNWSKIASFSEDCSEIFKKEIGQIEDDEYRVCIFHVIDILQDVHYSYEQRKQNLDLSLWRNTFWHVFNPHKRQAFVTAYYKYKKEQQFSKSFTKYVDLIIKQNQQVLKRGG